MTHCPRCLGPVAERQEYCLACGTRLPRSSAYVPASRARGWLPRTLIALAVALTGAVAAVTATGGSPDRTNVITATGGFATAPTSSTLPSPGGPGASAVAEWPVGEDGWTIVLASLAQTGGRQPAVVRARQAAKAGLASVGILDSSRYASLHPGYWLVFSGVYTSEAEATSALEPARRFARSATVRRIVS